MDLKLRKVSQAFALSESKQKRSPEARRPSKNSIAPKKTLRIIYTAVSGSRQERIYLMIALNLTTAQAITSTGYVDFIRLPEENHSAIANREKIMK